MTNYNERLDEILRSYGKELAKLIDDDNANPRDRFALQEEINGTLSEAKQAITSLIKELVAEAKPEVRVFDDGINDATYFQQKIVDQFEQNLLKALEEV